MKKEKDYDVMQEVCQRLAGNIEIVQSLEGLTDIRTIDVTINKDSANEYNFEIAEPNIIDGSIKGLKTQLKRRIADLYASLINV